MKKKKEPASIAWEADSFFALYFAVFTVKAVRRKQKHGGDPNEGKAGERGVDKGDTLRRGERGRAARKQKDK